MILTIQKDKSLELIEILFDKEGLEFLRAVLNKDWSEPTIDKKNYMILTMNIYQVKIGEVKN